MSSKILKQIFKSFKQLAVLISFMSFPGRHPGSSSASTPKSGIQAHSRFTSQVTQGKPTRLQNEPA